VSTCLVVLKHQYMRNQTYIYLTNLAITDILTLLVGNNDCAENNALMSTLINSHAIGDLLLVAPISLALRRILLRLENRRHRSRHLRLNLDGRLIHGGKVSNYSIELSPYLSDKVVIGFPPRSIHCIWCPFQKKVGNKRHQSDFSSRRSWEMIALKKMWSLLLHRKERIKSIELKATSKQFLPGYISWSHFASPSSILVFPVLTFHPRAVS